MALPVNSATMIGTIDSDAELSPEHASDDEEVAELNPMNAKKESRKRSINFGFDDGGLDFSQREIGHEDMLRSDDGSLDNNDNDGDDESGDGDSDDEEEGDENVKAMPYAASRSKRAAERHKGDESGDDSGDDGDGGDRDSSDEEEEDIE